MNVDELKNKILQLAIRGKLVEQNPEDTPASVLLEEIKKEKDKLIKEKKIKKEKALSEITDKERIFELPNGWEWCRLSEIANIIMGQSPESDSVSESQEGIEFHQGKTSFGEVLIKHSGLYCSKPSKIALKGDLLLSVRAPVGALNITDRDICIGRGLAAIRSFNRIETKYYYYFINAFEDELLKRATGTTFLAVSSSVIRELIIPLPPLQEQQRIIKKVDELFILIDKLNENREDIIKDIKNIRNKVLQLAIQGKLVKQSEYDEPVSILLERINSEKEQLIKDKKIKKEKALPEITDEEKKFDLPNGWEWCRLGNIANIVMGQSPDSKSVSDNNSGIEFHQGKTSFGEMFIKESGVYCTKPNKIAMEGDVLLSVRAPVGALNITNRELCIGRGLTAIRKIYGIENKFYYYFIKAFELELISRATGTTFLAVSSAVIKELLIPLPPLKEQIRIVKKIDEIMEYLDELEKTILESDLI